MSDEASCPESDDEDDKEDWTQKMALIWGTNERRARDLRGVKFLEVIKPNWRSDKVCLIIFIKKSI